MSVFKLIYNDVYAHATPSERLFAEELAKRGFNDVGWLQRACAIREGRMPRDSDYEEYERSMSERGCMEYSEHPCGDYYTDTDSDDDTCSDGGVDDGPPLPDVPKGRYLRSNP